MAEAVLEVALGNLNSLIQKGLGLFLGVDRELERLSSILTTIRAVLEDAEEKQLTNNALKDWLHKLKDAAYVLDDILDECATEALRLEYQGVNFGSAHKVGGSRLSSFHPKHALFRYRIAKKMKGIRERLDEIAEERIKFHLRETVTERRTEVMEWRETTSNIAEPQVYGREKDREDIVRFLVNHASGCDDISVYTIIGIGGLGKTTLAQYVFNDARIREHFELKFWVCVSENFSLKRILKAIINLAWEQVCEDSDLELLKEKLQVVFQGKRYLLVLDDVWNDDRDKWDQLKYVLACGSKGASILVTTRLATVASIMGTIHLHELPLLFEDHCWELFRQRAFGEDRGERAELVAIGKEIIKKCKGVPLAAKALGSLLRFKSEEKDWINVKESDIWNLPQEKKILPALRLSYLNLSAKARQCFAYCALFPKDEVMSKEDVIELWMANGFISSPERLDVEDIGDEVWSELYLKSFFQDIEMDSSGMRFKMHDLIHNLAQFVMEIECHCVTKDNDTTNLSKGTRHLLVDGYWPPKCYFLWLQQVKTLKTCIVARSGCDELLDAICPKKFDSLRVLRFSRLDKISSSIGHFKHLRYLNLSHDSFETLPNSITRLWTLQILNLDYCWVLQKLPDRLKCLKFLRHLHLEGCSSLKRLAPEIGRLNFLRTLNIYIVGQQKGFLLAELGCLNLKGNLHIKHLERVRSVLDAKEANMASKHLRELSLSWERNEESQLQENVEQILEMLQPHTQKLGRLDIEGYMGAHYPQWMGSPTLNNLNALEQLHIARCDILEPLTEQMLQGLTSLKILIINDYPMFKLSAGFQYLTSLKYLKIARCKELDDFPEALQHLTTLRWLFLDNLPNLVSLPSWLGNLRSLEFLFIFNCPKLTSLPMSIQCLGSLKVLEIVDCRVTKAM